MKELYEKYGIINKNNKFNKLREELSYSVLEDPAYLELPMPERDARLNTLLEVADPEIIFNVLSNTRTMVMATGNNVVRFSLSDDRVRFLLSLLDLGKKIYLLSRIMDNSFSILCGHYIDMVSDIPSDMRADTKISDTSIVDALKMAMDKKSNHRNIYPYNKLRGFNSEIDKILNTEYPDIIQKKEIQYGDKYLSMKDFLKDLPIYNMASDIHYSMHINDFIEGKDIDAIINDVKILIDTKLIHDNLIDVIFARIIENLSMESILMMLKSTIVLKYISHRHRSFITEYLLLRGNRDIVEIFSSLTENPEKLMSLYDNIDFENNIISLDNIRRSMEMLQYFSEIQHPDSYAMVLLICGSKDIKKTFSEIMESKIISSHTKKDIIHEMSYIDLKRADWDPDGYIINTNHEIYETYENALLDKNGNVELKRNIDAIMNNGPMPSVTVLHEIVRYLKKSSNPKIYSYEYTDIMVTILSRLTEVTRTYSSIKKFIKDNYQLPYDDLTVKILDMFDVSGKYYGYLDGYVLDAMYRTVWRKQYHHENFNTTRRIISIIRKYDSMLKKDAKYYSGIMEMIPYNIDGNYEYILNNMECSKLMLKLMAKIPANRITNPYFIDFVMNNSSREFEVVRNRMMELLEG